MLSVLIHFYEDKLWMVRATQLPMVFLTSNNTGESSEALKRRCLYSYINYPDIDRERGHRAPPGAGHLRGAGRPGGPHRLRSLRTIDLRSCPRCPRPSTGGTLVVLGISSIPRHGGQGQPPHPAQAPEVDIDKAAKELLSASEL